MGKILKTLRIVTQWKFTIKCGVLGRPYDSNLGVAKLLLKGSLIDALRTDNLKQQ